MHTTYHLKARDIDNHLLDAIRTLFEEDDYLTITIESEIVDNPVGEADLFRFLEIEKNSLLHMCRPPWISIAWLMR